MHRITIETNLCARIKYACTRNCVRCIMHIWTRNSANSQFPRDRDVRQTTYAICKLTRKPWRILLPSRGFRAISRIPKYVFCINFRHRLYLKQPFTFSLPRARAYIHSLLRLPYLRSFQRIRFACAHFFCMQPTFSLRIDPDSVKDAFPILPTMLFNEPNFLQRKKKKKETFGTIHVNLFNKNIDLIDSKYTMFNFQMIFASFIVSFISRGWKRSLKNYWNFYTPLFVGEEKNQGYEREILSDIH